MPLSRASRRRSTRRKLPSPVRRLADDPEGTYREHSEWAWGVRTTPREKLVLTALATRHGARADHLTSPCCMSEGAIAEALDVLVEDGWVYAVGDGGFAIEPATEEVLPTDSRLAIELAARL